MKIEFTPRASEGVERHIQVSVPAEAVKDAEDKAARRYASTVRLPGFRPGKAPATVVRKKFGEAIRQEALESIVREAYEEFVEKESIKVAAQPHVHDLKFEEGKPLTFELHLEVRPTVELARTHGFKIQKPPVEVTEEQLNQQLEQIRDEKATWTPVEEKPKPGDMVNVQIATAPRRRSGRRKELSPRARRGPGDPGNRRAGHGSRAGRDRRAAGEVAGRFSGRITARPDQDGAHHAQRSEAEVGASAR